MCVKLDLKIVQNLNVFVRNIPFDYNQKEAKSAHHVNLLWNCVHTKSHQSVLLGSTATWIRSFGSEKSTRCSRNSCQTQWSFSRQLENWAGNPAMYRGLLELSNEYYRFVWEQEIFKKIWFNDFSLTQFESASNKMNSHFEMTWTKF